jgi:hypothetical protein
MFISLPVNNTTPPITNTVIRAHCLRINCILFHPYYMHHTAISGHGCVSSASNQILNQRVTIKLICHEIAGIVLARRKYQNREIYTIMSRNIHKY